MEVATTGRLRSLDVVRGIALIGVIALNYHAVLNEQDAFSPIDASSFSRLFNPISGVLTTRFAATFVFVAGIGVTLMSSRLKPADVDGVHRLRLTLLRRGAFLLLVGYGLEWMWPGTILFYYGAYFIIASVLVNSSTRIVITTAIASIAVAAGLHLWRVSERFDDNYTAWLDPASVDSPRNVALRLFVGYTHPIFPWLAFFLAGMVVARGFSGRRMITGQHAAVAGILVVGAYLLRDLVRPSLITDRAASLRASAVSLQPFDRGILFVLSTLGIAVLAMWSIERLVARQPNSKTFEALARAGRMSLTLYVAHILIFKLVVDVLGVVRPTGLDTALVLTLAVYVGGLVVAWFVLSRRSHGPVEWLYRMVGGR